MLAMLAFATVAIAVGMPCLVVWLCSQFDQKTTPIGLRIDERSKHAAGPTLEDRLARVASPVA